MSSVVLWMSVSFFCEFRSSTWVCKLFWELWNPIHPWVLLWVNLGDPCETLCCRPYPGKKSHLLPRHTTFIKWSYGTICLLLRPSLKPNPLWVCCFVHSSYWTSWFSGSFVNSCLGLKILPRVVQSDSLTLHTRSFWKELWIWNSIWF